MICCVSSDQKLMAQTLIALDYCHKIKCYFNGITEDEVKQILLNMPGDRSLYRDIGRLYQKMWGIKSVKLPTVTLESIKQRALEISRACDIDNIINSEAKRMVTILMKEIET